MNATGHFFAIEMSVINKQQDKMKVLEQGYSYLHIMNRREAKLKTSRTRRHFDIR